MKTILVPAGGGDSDSGIFETALAAARPLAAHLDFYHVKIEAGEAAINTPHAGFVMGRAVNNTLDRLHADTQSRFKAARDHVEEFCRKYDIPMLDRPNGRTEVSASWTDESGDSTPLIIRRARHSDLVVAGRRRSRNHLPDDLLERLLIKSGRPILVAPSSAAQSLTGTAMVCWKECAEAAHAVTAAMPLLRHAGQVVIVAVSEDDDYSALASVDDLARRMAWHGIHAQPQCIAPNGRAVAQVLSGAARDLRADLVVMGGYSQSRIKEMIFGGCTETFLRAAECAVMLVH